MNEIINFGDGKSVKVMLLKGEAGNNIQSIYKTSTSGLVDTYTITLTDGTTTTFQVTNGSNIQSIDKTGTSGLVDTYTVTLTNGNTSTFTVTNGGGNVDNAFKVMGYNGAKNLLPYPYYHTTRTYNGITYTDNGDGTITCNGTATAISYFVVKDRATKEYQLGVGNYFVSGCPVNGSTSTYQMYMTYLSSDGSIINLATDVGSGKAFSVTQAMVTNNTNYAVGFVISISNGTTVNNLTFRPMIRRNEDTDSTYQPYAMTNKELQDNKVNNTNIAPIENGATASQLLYMNDYIMRKNELWRLDHNIASGATITEGTDIIKTSVGAELNKRLEVVNIDANGNDGQYYGDVQFLKNLAFQTSLLLKGHRYIYGKVMNNNEQLGTYQSIADNAPDGIVNMIVQLFLYGGGHSIYSVHKDGTTYKIWVISMDEVIVN